MALSDLSDLWEEMTAAQPVVMDDGPVAPARPARRPLLLEWHGNELESPYTDAEAAEICGRLPISHPSRGYTQGIIRDLTKYGSLFPGKRYWLHEHARRWVENETKIADAERLAREEAERALYGNEPAASNFDKVPAGRLANIATFLAAGAAKIETGARVTFESGPFLVSVHSTSRNKTRWPGAFLVTGCTGFERPNVPLALIDAAGSLYWSDAGRLCPEVHALLEAFEADPVNFVSMQGLAQERCVFCRRDLSDPISMTMGYGPVCAVHYGLPHSAEAMQCKRAARPAPAVA